jgi:hypothetical protein
MNTDRQAKSCGKDGQRTPLEIASRFPLSHSYNNNNLDDPDHFLENPIRQRRFAPTTDRIHPGTVIAISSECRSASPESPRRTNHFESCVFSENLSYS